MGVVTASSSASQTPLGLNRRFSSHQSLLRRPLILAFKRSKNKKTSLVSPVEPNLLPIETAKNTKKRCGSLSQPLRRAQAVSSELVSPYIVELDYNEAAAKLETIYKLSDPIDSSSEDEDERERVHPRSRRKTLEYVRRDNDGMRVVKNKVRKPKRLSLDTRITLKKKNEEKKQNEEKRKNEEKAVCSNKKRRYVENEDDKIDRLVRDYTSSTDLVSLDWKKMRIPPVLPAAEHTWLFRLMQPMKTLVQVKELLQKELGRLPKDLEVGKVTNMAAADVKRHMEVGHAARNKLIKHNMRLVLFVMNKYFQEFTNGPKFQDLCQAGVNGLITAIDRFEPKRKFRLSTYGLFWIRHAIVRSMTVSSFTRVSFGLETVRFEIQKAKLELMFELKRMPREEEIIERVGISHGRYLEVMRASNPIYSLNTRHAVTQEELINGITDVDGVGGDKRRQPALLRLALDDVLDSLKPKESLVIRQRYGLDGKGDRTLGEIAGNLNISREMVRKHEVKGLMKLKHPARVDYLRQYIY